MCGIIFVGVLSVSCSRCLVMREGALTPNPIGTTALLKSLCQPFETICTQHEEKQGAAGLRRKSHEVRGFIPPSRCQSEEGYALPESVVTDRGTSFMLKTFDRFCSSRGMKHVLKSTGHPRAYGQVRRVNRDLLPTIMIIMGDSDHQE